MQETFDHPPPRKGLAASHTNAPKAAGSESDQRFTPYPSPHSTNTGHSQSQQPRTAFPHGYSSSNLPIAPANYSYYPPTPTSYVPTTDSAEMMATHSMRPAMPSMYNTPSHSPPSVSSPQDPRSRLLYSQAPQSMYYPSYTLPSHNTYMPHTAPHQQSFGQPQPLAMQYTHHPSHSLPSQNPSHRGVGHELQPLGSTHQRPLSQMGPPSLGPPRTSDGGRSHSSSQGANPGPIPASTPRVISQSPDGIQKISFEYSRERQKVSYTIDCNIESVDTTKLTKEFKENNCVYPRAVGDRGEYRGNRWNYENDCNEIAWALASLNECIQNKRGLIQRAVDSWRNSAADTKLRSRRVRRMAKNTKRQMQQNAQAMQRTALSTVASTPTMGQGSTSWDPSVFHSHNVPAPSRTGSGVEGDGSVASSYQTSPSLSYDFKAANAMDRGIRLPSTGSVAGKSFTSASTASPNQASHIMSRSMSRPMSSHVTIDDKTLFGSPQNLPKQQSILIRDQKDEFTVRPLLDAAGSLTPEQRNRMALYHLSHGRVEQQDLHRSMGSDLSHIEHGMTRELRFMNGQSKTATLPKPSVSVIRHENAVGELGHRLAAECLGQMGLKERQDRGGIMGILSIQRCLDTYRKEMKNISPPGPYPEHMQLRPGKQRWVDESKNFSQAAATAA